MAFLSKTADWHGLLRRFYRILTIFKRIKVEVILDSLPTGRYVLLLASKPNFDDGFDKITSDILNADAMGTEGVKMQILRTSASAISVFYTPESKNYRVINRASGEPMRGVKMQVKESISFSDANGVLHKPASDSAVFTFQQDTLIWWGRNFKTEGTDTMTMKTRSYAFIFLQTETFIARRKKYFLKVLS